MSHYARLFNVPVHFASDEPQYELGPLTLQEKTVVPQKAILKGTSYVLPLMNTRMAPIFDQGALGSCVANALVSAFDQVDTSPVGSRLFCYQNARQIVGSPSQDSGTTVQAGVQALTRYGLCYESTWPYIISKFASKPSTQAYTQGLSNRVVIAKKIPQTRQALKDYLLAGYPVAVGILVYTSFVSSTVAKTGVVNMPGSRESLLGGHAVLVVGFDDATQRWTLRNSWGSSWGQAGYFTLPQTQLDNTNLASDFWVITQTI